MDKAVQPNVRIAPSDRAPIVTLAQRSRSDPGFRDQMKSLLDGSSTLSSDRVKKLEQQVGWLLSGAIVMPRSGPPCSAPWRIATPRGNSEPR